MGIDEFGGSKKSVRILTLILLIYFAPIVAVTGEDGGEKPPISSFVPGNMPEIVYVAVFSPPYGNNEYLFVNITFKAAENDNTTDTYIENVKISEPNGTLRRNFTLYADKDYMVTNVSDNYFSPYIGHTPPFIIPVDLTKNNTVTIVTDEFGLFTDYFLTNAYYSYPYGYFKGTEFIRTENVSTEPTAAYPDNNAETFISENSYDFGCG